MRIQHILAIDCCVMAQTAGPSCLCSCLWEEAPITVTVGLVSGSHFCPLPSPPPRLECGIRAVGQDAQSQHRDGDQAAWLREPGR